MAWLSDVFSSMFTYGFAQRALLAGIFVSLCAAVLGVSLVLKRYSMIGDGLSHIAYGSMAVALAVNSLPMLGLNIDPLAVGLPVVVLAAFLLLHISEHSRISGDAAIAMISSGALAIGIIATTLGSGINVDVNNYLFGSILSMSERDVFLCVGLSIAVIILYFVFYKQLFAVTFDEMFAKASGMPVDLIKMLIALLTALTVVVGMRIMGTLLMSSLIIFPALSAMRVCRSFRAVVLLSAVLSVGCFFVGFTASFALNTPVGASIVCVNIISFTVCSLVGHIKR